MPVKNAIAKNWASWIRGSDGYLRSDDPFGVYGSYTPVLPQATVDTTYSLPTGNTWTATNTGSNSAAGTGTGNRTGCGLQYALDNCALNDIIEVTGGATYTGQFTLKYKASGSGWIYIRPSTHASLPAVGTRAVAADASNMAKLTGAAANTATIITENNSCYYRLIGLEITTSSTTALPLQAAVCMIMNSDTSNSTVCNHIIFDRCYIHGSADSAHSGRRGVWMDGENLAVVDSRVSGFYDNGSDSQAILVIQGNGPFKFHNNYLEGASENINFGGVDPSITNSVPQDITFTNNYCFKPLSWIGAGHNVKNLFETKNSRRLLVEGNVFENNWADGQSGQSLLLTPRNQSNTAPWCGVFDTTIRLNKFINCGAGINISGDDDNFSSQRTDRVLVENNLLLINDPNPGTPADNRVFQVLRGPEYITIQHNTAVITAGIVFYIANTNGGLPKGLGANLINNLATNPNRNIFANGLEGTAALTAEFDAFTGNYNVMHVISPATDPSPTYYPASVAAIGFTNYAGGDYSLTGASTYHNAASDGTDSGCDIAALNAAIAGVV